MWRCCARSSAAVRVTEKLRFCARSVVLSLHIRTGSHSAFHNICKIPRSFDTAENGSKWVFLKDSLRKTIHVVSYIMFKWQRENAILMLRLKCGNVSKDAHIGVPPFYARAHTRSARQRCPQPPKKINENHCFDMFYSRKNHVKSVIFIDFLRWLGHPLAGLACNYKVSQAEVPPAT